MEPAHLGPALRRLRQVRGLKQWELAEKIGSTKSHLSSLELSRRFPRFPTLVRILDGLGATLGDLDRAVRWASRQPDTSDTP